MTADEQRIPRPSDGLAVARVDQQAHPMVNPAGQPSSDKAVHRLSEVERRRFAGDGALLRRNALLPSQTAELRSALNRLLRGTLPPAEGVLLRHEPMGSATTAENPGRVWMASNLILAGPPWPELVRDPRIVVPLMDLLGPDVDLYNAFARVKPPGTRAHLAWHQDFAHERHNHPRLVTVIIYLDDTGPGAAATEVIPRSHRQGLLPYDAMRDLASQRVRGQIRTLAATAGSILFLHTLIVHRAGQNLTPADRRAVLIVARAAGCREVGESPHAMTGMPLARDGACLPPILINRS